MQITGSCHCGKITYEAELDPGNVGICHCSDCQAMSGSAYRTIAVVQADKFRLTGDAPKEYVKKGDSGRGRIQAFCPNCGSGIYATNAEGTPVAYNVRTGTIRERNDLPPRFEYWCQSALHWLPELHGTVKYDRQTG